MASISEIIEATVARRGKRAEREYARPAIDAVTSALQAREDQIVSALRRVATRKGLSATETDQILSSVGLTPPRDARVVAAEQAVTQAQAALAQAQAALARA